MKSARERVLFFLAGVLLLALAGCTPESPRKNPVGLEFPTVNGTSLNGDSIVIPRAFIGTPTLLLVGYLQNSQFDIDRWLLGLVQLETPVVIREIPTVRGMVPRLIANKIDSGMRSGIPKDDWDAVITVYKDAGIIADFLGTEDSLNARVVLLDASGKVIWYHDRGYSATVVSDLDRRVRTMQE